MDVMNYIEMDPDHMKLCDEAKSPHLWTRDASCVWKLRHNVMKTGWTIKIMSGKVYIVHAIDTEGPLYESLDATFDRIRECLI